VHCLNTRPQRGFTVLELIISMVVAVILTTISVPLISNVQAQYRMRSAVSSVTGAISSTRYRAIYQGYPFAVAFSKTNGTYQLSSKVPTATSFSNVGNAVPFQAAGMSIDQDNTFTFSPSGVVTSSVGALEVDLSYKGKTSKITVSSYGNVKVTEQ
jgi:type IV fimbrial biogenesis protein FimT